MSVLVVGLSHASAPVATLERAAVTPDALPKLLQDIHTSDNVAGAFILSTCNRVEVYAEVDRFHGGVAAICELLARHSGLPHDELTGVAYVHYEDRAVQHLLAVTCGLESMVVGESQILGQVREAVRLAREHGTLSRELSDLSALALRTGKRAHAETGIDAAGQSLVSLGLEIAVAALGGPAEQDGGPGRSVLAGPDSGGPPPLAGRSVLVVGAGSMSSLAVATASRQGAASIVVANRTHRNADRLAREFGARAGTLAELPSLMAAADLVITCTGAAGHVVTAEAVAAALELRGPGGPGALVLLDLALPRDVAPEAAGLPGARLIDLAEIGADGGAASASLGSLDPDPAHPTARAGDVAAVRKIVAQELDGYLRADRAARVAPTVVALRAKAAAVVESELARLERRLGNLDSGSRREIAHAMGRIADKLLHGPTVQVKALAGAPAADSYETALRVLFELDADAVRAVVSIDEDFAPADPEDAL